MSTEAEVSTNSAPDASAVYVDKGSKEVDGVLGCLTPKQQEALDVLKANPDCAGLDDRALLRFLRSRQFRIPESTEMAVNYLKWYNDNHIAEMAASLPGKVELMGRLVPHAFHGFDRHGHPVYIERAGAIDPYLLMSQVSDNEILMSHVWGQENQIRRCDESSRARGLPPGSIERFTTLMDLKGMTMTHRACLKFTKKITEWDEKYYPERMGYVVVVNPPGIFSLFWNIVKLWLDPVTKSKIVVCKNGFDALHELIDPSQLPARYGGTSTEPGLEEALADPDYAAMRAEFQSDAAWVGRLTDISLASGQKHRLELAVEPHETYEWFFKCDEPVGFQARFYPTGTPVTAPDTDANVLIVTNWSRCEANKVPNQGAHTGDGAGTLVLLWDNDNWWGAKQLTFGADHARPRPHLTADAAHAAAPAAASAAAPAAAAVAVEGKAEAKTDGEADGEGESAAAESKPEDA